MLDILVIGSGFGGAVAATRLVEAGQKVTLLERGSWRNTTALKQYDLSERAHLPHNKYFSSHILRQVSNAQLGRSQLINKYGLFDIHYDANMTTICSSGVGGGSHVYLAINTRPLNKTYWNNHAQGINSQSMEAHYEWILTRMGSRPVQAKDNIDNLISNKLQQHPAINTDVTQPALGFNFNHNNSYANNAFLGDANGHKVTLDSQLLAPLLNKGLTVLAQHECLAITKQEIGYRVDVFDHAQQKYRFFTAKRVIVAAGTLNTLRLLFQSQSQGGLATMPALGKGFSGNGDVFALWKAGSKDDDFRIGTPTLGRFKVRGLKNSPLLYSLGINGIDNIPLIPSFIRKHAGQWLILVGMGNDEANGKVTWRKNQLHFNYQQDTNPILASIYNALHKIANARNEPLWFTKQNPITVHPLGGARIGQTTKDSVINAYGKIHGHQYLYITDGSALPAATGTPPSMTIAAWASHVSQHILSEINHEKTL